jgi:hypothetical protein
MSIIAIKLLDQLYAQALSQSNMSVSCQWGNHPGQMGQSYFVSLATDVLIVFQ